MLNNYCQQNSGDCQSCSLGNYNRDCHNEAIDSVRNITGRLFGDTDYLELLDWQQSIVSMPQIIATQNNEIKRLRDLLITARNFTPAQWDILLSSE